MSRFWLSFPMVLLASACTEAGNDATIREAEAQLVMPAKADPLSQYDRYYAISGKTATGIYIWSEAGRGKFAIVAAKKDLPFVADGGCGVIHVELDLEKKAWKPPYCNVQI